jgi:hypothetical protein
MHPQRLPPDADAGGMEVTAGFKPKVDSGQYSYGTHAVVVEIDRALGSVQILDYVIVEDCGTMVNPMIVEGQSIGGRRRASAPPCLKRWDSTPTASLKHQLSPSTCCRARPRSRALPSTT